MTYLFLPFLWLIDLWERLRLWNCPERCERCGGWWRMTPFDRAVGYNLWYCRACKHAMTFKKAEKL